MRVGSREGIEVVIGYCTIIDEKFLPDEIKLISALLIKMLLYRNLFRMEELG